MRALLKEVHKVLDNGFVYNDKQLICELIIMGEYDRLIEMLEDDIKKLDIKHKDGNDSETIASLSEILAHVLTHKKNIEYDEIESI